MRQLIRTFLWLGGLALGLQSAWGFALLGPLAAQPGGESWQIQTIGYGLTGDVGGPRNIGEEYRHTTPVMYYACDASFLDYFGSDGTNAIDQAFDVLNGVMTNGVDSYDYTSYASTNLFPFSTLNINLTANALDIFDLKTVVVQEMMEQLGLASPWRFAWTLVDRNPVPGFTNPCPAGIAYIVAQMNFDPITWAPSAYLNNNLLTYTIVDNCKGTPIPEAQAVPSTTALIPNYPLAADAIGGGVFYTGLTWDDVGGLRYIYSTNNLNNEATPAGSLLFSTNVNSPQLIFTANYNALVSAATTNGPAALQALFPGLVVGPNPPTYFSNVVSLSEIAYFTNFVGQPADSPPTLVVTAVYVTNIVQFYQNSFGNVVTNKTYPTTSYFLQTITAGRPLGLPVGSPFVTNTTLQPFQSNIFSGDYYIISNGACGPNIIQTFTNVNVVTNNIVGITNANGQMFVQNLISYFTNYVLVVQPCTLVTNGVGLYQGVGKMRFVKTTYDSLFGTFYQPITNQFTKVLLTNSQYVTQTFQRVVTTPDFIFSTTNITIDPTAHSVNATWFVIPRTAFCTPDAGYAVGGPGVIDPNTDFLYAKLANTYYVGPASDTNTILGQSSPLATNNFIWGSFNASTNMVVYPTNVDIQNLENQAVIQIIPPPPVLPPGTNGTPYSVTFATTGGSFAPAYSWSLATGSAGLPPGLNLSTITNNEGMISGTPTQTGTFDNILIQMSDSLGRSVRWPYSITVQPP